MVLDTSALLALLFQESDWRPIAEAISIDPIRLMASATALECYIVVLARLGADGCDDLELLSQKIGLKIESDGMEQLALAKRAFFHYGKGRHPAGLNFGDCFSYALAKSSGQPLLFKGNDFVHTDVPRVEWTSGGNL